MRIFAIRDEANPDNREIAFLLYYEQDKRFYIELPENADPWQTPLLLSSFLKRGEHTVNAYWSRVWVQQRIIPSDRQNLGQILKDNGLATYDEFELLLLAEGRCAQDDYYLEPVAEADLPENFLARFQKKVEDVVSLTQNQILVFFRNGKIKKCDLRELFANDRTFSMVGKNEKLFRGVDIQPGGYGVCWGEELNIADSVLYQLGEDVPLVLEDFRRFVESRIVNTAEAAELLDCSRQNIDDLIRRDKLHPVKATSKNKLFLKSEIIQRKWK